MSDPGWKLCQRCKQEWWETHGDTYHRDLLCEQCCELLLDSIEQRYRERMTKRGLQTNKTMPEGPGPRHGE